MKPVLSVCMMVKNEEENLERCLLSLKPLLAAVPSELIIIDTGSTDRTVEIAAQFTDKIYHHPWDNDFSGMRNTSIGYAKGQWIMIIDADEELSDAMPIKRFLEKKRSDKVVAGALKLINVKKNDKGRIAAVLQTPRLFLNNGKFRYEGIVHNVPVVEGYTEEIVCELYHYGYNADDPELMEKKFVRTSNLLIAALEKDPDNIYYRFQLSVTYHMHNDYSKALFEILKAYELLKEAEEEKKTSSYVYPQLVKCYLMNGFYDKALEAAQEALVYEPENFDLYFFKAQAQLMCGADREGIESYLKYLSLVNRYHELDIRLNLRIQTLTNTTECQCEAYHNLAVTYNKLQDYEKAFIYTTRFFENPSFRYVASFHKTFSLHLELSDRFNRFKAVVSQLNGISDPILKEDLLREIEEKGYTRRVELCRLLSAVHGAYGDLNRLRSAYGEGNLKSADIVNRYLNKEILSRPPYWLEVIYFALAVRGDVAGLFATWSETDMIKAISTMDERFSDLPQVLLSYVEAHDMEDTYQWANFSRVAFKYLAYKETVPAQREKYCLNYTQAGFQFIRNKYSEAFIPLGAQMLFLSEEERFLMDVMSRLKDFDTDTVYSRLAGLKKQYPFMEIFLDYFLKAFQPTRGEKGQWEVLEDELVTRIAVLIKSGDEAAAVDILEQAIQIMPQSRKMRLIRNLIVLKPESVRKQDDN